MGPADIDPTDRADGRAREQKRALAELPGFNPRNECGPLVRRKHEDGRDVRRFAVANRHAAIRHGCDFDAGIRAAPGAPAKGHRQGDAINCCLRCYRRAWVKLHRARKSHIVHERSKENRPARRGASDAQSFDWRTDAWRSAGKCCAQRGDGARNASVRLDARRRGGLLRALSMFFVSCGSTLRPGVRDVFALLR